MINWFGPESWDAPLCADTPRRDVPVGVACARCERALIDTDYGVTMPGSDGPVSFHLACFQKSILPHERWPQNDLVPDATDPSFIFQHGRFECPVCGMVYQPGVGWLRRLV